METKKNYTVGEDSRRFLDALNAFQVFKCAFLDALVNVYGEQQGDEMYQSHNELLENVEREIMDYLRVLFTQSMVGDAVEITI